MNKIIEYGSLYGQHSRWGVYNSEGIAPTLTAAMGLGGGFVPMIVEDFYSNRDVRIYREYSPTIRSERLGLKVVENN